MAGWFDEDEAEKLREGLWEVTGFFTQSLLGHRMDDLDGDPEVARRLAILATCEEISRQVAKNAAVMAHASACAGAAYPQIAEATGLTPQGAQRRWPGLTQVRRQAAQLPDAGTADDAGR